MSRSAEGGEERYRAFIQLSSEGIWLFELENPVRVSHPEEEQIDAFFRGGYLAECNDAMARMYGFAAASELIGARLTDFLVPSDPHNREYLRAFIRSGYHLQDAESHEVDRNGEEKSFLNNLIGVVEDGLILRAWGTQRDITERKRVEEALRRSRQELVESEQRYRTLTAEAPVGIFQTDAGGNCLFVNQRWCELAGLTPEEAAGHGWTRALYPEDRERVFREVG